MARRLARSGFTVPIAHNENNPGHVPPGTEDHGAPDRVDDPDVYVETRAAAANSNDGSYVYVKDGKNMRSCFMPTPNGAEGPERHAGRRSGIKIFSNFPDSMPVLPQEIAIIETYLSDLIARVNANDNEDT